MKPREIDRSRLAVIGVEWKPFSHADGFIRSGFRRMRMIKGTKEEWDGNWETKQLITDEISGRRFEERENRG